MFKAINGDANLLLWDGPMVRVTRTGDGRIEIVAYPSYAATVSYRQAREPYVCTLHLADGKSRCVDLGTPEDWGDIQECYPDECGGRHSLGWGNDVDGHVEIVGVTGEDGAPIPMSEFVRDVKDFVIYHEA